VYLPDHAAARLVETARMALAAFSQSAELRGAGLVTEPIQQAVPGSLPPLLSVAMLPALARRATERRLVR